MDDTIEVCSGCGKMPRIMESSGGHFICSRCGNNSTIFVTASDYEKVVTDLDQKFHHNLLARKMKEAHKMPVKIPKRKAGAKKAAKKKPAKAPKKKTKRKN